MNDTEEYNESQEINMYRAALARVIVDECNVHLDDETDLFAYTLRFRYIEELKLAIEMLLQKKPQGEEGVNKIIHMVYEAGSEYYSDACKRNVSFAQWASDFRRDEHRCIIKYKANREKYISMMYEIYSSIPLYRRCNIEMILDRCQIAHRGDTILHMAFDDLTKMANEHGFGLCRDLPMIYGDGVRFLKTGYFDLGNDHMKEAYISYGYPDSEEMGITYVSVQIRMSMLHYSISVKKDGEWKQGRYIFDDDELGPVLEFLSKKNIESYKLSKTERKPENNEYFWGLTLVESSADEEYVQGIGYVNSFNDLPEYFRSIVEYLIDCSKVLEKKE